jgi:hypothetical protein
MLNRWRFVAHGEIGYVWHDTLYNRYVLSDQYGPAGFNGSGPKRLDPVLFQDAKAAPVSEALNQGS